MISDVCYDTILDSPNRLKAGLVLTLPANSLWTLLEITPLAVVFLVSALGRITLSLASFTKPCTRPKF